MNQQNPIKKAWANAEKSYFQHQKGKVRRQKSLSAAHEYLEGTHRYERTFSDKRVGEMRVMNGRDAKELNDKLFEDFLVAVETNVVGRSLERWGLDEKFVDADPIH